LCLWVISFLQMAHTADLRPNSGTNNFVWKPLKKISRLNN